MGNMRNTIAAFLTLALVGCQAPALTVPTAAAASHAIAAKAPGRFNLTGRVTMPKRSVLAAVPGNSKVYGYQASDITELEVTLLNGGAKVGETFTAVFSGDEPFEDGVSYYFNELQPGGDYSVAVTAYAGSEPISDDEPVAIDGVPTLEELNSEGGVDVSVTMEAIEVNLIPKPFAARLTVNLVGQLPGRYKVEVSGGGYVESVYRNIDLLSSGSEVVEFENLKGDVNYTVSFFNVVGPLEIFVGDDELDINSMADSDKAATGVPDEYTIEFAGSPL